MPVTRNGFGNPYNYGVRTMVSTPHGLFVGTANPFGPEVAVQRSSGWAYEINPRGGCEIWLGSDKSILPPEQRGGAEAEKGDERAPPVVVSSKSEEESIDLIIDQFYENSPVRSFGCWGNKANRAKSSSANMIEELLSFIPAKSGNVLWLGCSAVGELEGLAKHYPWESITALEFGRQAKIKHSKSKVIKGDKPPIKLPDNSMDLVINIETLSRHEQAWDWISSAAKILKPGGQFIGAEILSGHPDSPWNRRLGWMKYEVPKLPELEEQFRLRGFGEVRVVDATKACWQAFSKQLNLFLWDKNLENEVDDNMIQKVKDHLYGWCHPIHSYVFIIARKN